MKIPNKDEIITRMDHLLAKDAAALYRQDFVNHRGTDLFTEEPLTEIIAAHLLDRGCAGALADLAPLSRGAPYLDAPKRGEGPGGVRGLKREERFIKRLAGEQLEQLGRCLDCMIPLGDDDEDRVNRIDLVCHASERNRILLVEVKYNKNEDTLLQAVLAIATRFRLLDGDRFLAEVARHLGLDPGVLALQPAVWTVKGKDKTGPGDIKLPYAFDEADGSRQRPKLCELIEKLNVEIYWGRDDPLKAKTMVL